ENMKLRWFIKENTDLKTRIEELEKNRIETTAKNAELKARVAKLEQNFEHRLEDGDNSSENIVNVLNPEKVCNEIRQHNKERKLPCESDKNQSQDLSPINHNISAKNIINLYQNACNAKESAMKANQKEIYYVELQKVIDYFSSNHDNSSTEISTALGLSNHVTRTPKSSSEKNDQDSELPEAEVNVSTEETKSGVSDSSISANSETEISMPPMSQQFPYLTLKYSNEYGDYFNCPKTCLVCNKEHWESGDYVNTKTYHLK
ncbi:7439_t:CDS:2, partial [Gigaspora rosea]